MNPTTDTTELQGRRDAVGEAPLIALDGAQIDVQHQGDEAQLVIVPAA